MILLVLGLIFGWFFYDVERLGLCYLFVHDFMLGSLSKLKCSKVCVGFELNFGILGHLGFLPSQISLHMSLAIPMLKTARTRHGWTHFLYIISSINILAFILL